MNKETQHLEVKNEETVKETVKEEKVVKKLTKEELKAKFRSAEMQFTGRINIDEKYKVPGKHLRIDNADAGTRKYMELLGYTPVRAVSEDRNGTTSLSGKTSMGSEVEYDLAVSGTSQPAILYECDQDVYDVRMEIQGEDNDAQLQNTIEANQREDQINRKK